ncbi:hypothetical protein LRP52_24000 [Photobacterium sp. ZSDE20]|uniref:PRTRC system protein F n=1 Tax=Photobacterium pectinilyticum TaxID=2906793 RepID=A0ABT1N3F1_9GAMM|nr:hypothetical protein [Photobacterium sp. ZSDE20]MCQ1058379.1 hypothetical protein [Photobacterium sp. ZSDE20]MDD1825258.1 hypothetical protein [Photobacterium sp. ZSDE20]
MLALQSVDKLPCFEYRKTNISQINIMIDAFNAQATIDPVGGDYDLTKRFNAERFASLLELASAAKSPIYNELYECGFDIPAQDFPKYYHQIAEDAMGYCRDFYEAELVKFGGIKRDINFVRATVSVDNECCALEVSENVFSVVADCVVACTVDMDKYSQSYSEAIMTMVPSLYILSEENCLEATVMDSFQLMDAEWQHGVDDYNLPFAPDVIRHLGDYVDNVDHLSDLELMELMGIKEDSLTPYGEPIEGGMVRAHIEAAIYTERQSERLSKVSHLGSWKAIFRHCIDSLPEPQTEDDKAVFPRLKTLRDQLENAPDRIYHEQDEVALSGSFIFAFMEGNDCLVENLINEINEHHWNSGLTSMSMVRSASDLLDLLTATALVNVLADIVSDD